MFKKKSKTIKETFLELSDVGRFNKMYAQPGPNVSCKTAGSKTVLLNLETGSFFALESSGAMMWKMFEEGKSLKEAIEEIARAFMVGRRTVTPDLISIVNNLLKDNLIRLKFDVV